MLSRRNLIALAAAFGAAACARQETATRAATVPAGPNYPPVPDFYEALTDEPYPIPAVPEGSLAPLFWRQEVTNPWPGHPRGTIVVDPDAKYLYYVISPDLAMRYGVSVGARGFEWDGTARLQFCRKWPRWKVPASTIRRHPDLERYSVANGGMDPGPGNPMGARALYLFQNGEDTLFRIHGSAVPQEIGLAVSAGCIRMLDQDVIHLHARAVHGANVIVLPSSRPEQPTML